MFEEFIELYNKCDHKDIKLRHTINREFKLWLNDYDYFQEEFRDYNDSVAIWKLKEWLNENCISKSYFPITYNFEDFIIYITYVSEVC